MLRVSDGVLTVRGMLYRPPLDFRGMASCYYRGGAKGLYLFNAPYCGRYDTDGRHHDEDTFGIVCREGLSPDSIRGKPMKVPPPHVDFPMPCD